MKILVCGGRNFSDNQLLTRVLNEFQVSPFGPITHLVQGGARGADTLALRWALGEGLTVTTYPARWNTEGIKTAGPLRNQRMLDDSRPDLFAAFPGNNGTRDMIDRAVSAGFAPFLYLYGVKFYWSPATPAAYRNAETRPATSPRYKLGIPGSNDAIVSGVELLKAGHMILERATRLDGLATLTMRAPSGEEYERVTTEADETAMVEFDDRNAPPSPVALAVDLYDALGKQPTGVDRGNDITNTTYEGDGGKPNGWDF